MPRRRLPGWVEMEWRLYESFEPHEIDRKMVDAARRASFAIRDKAIQSYADYGMSVLLFSAAVDSFVAEKKSLIAARSAIIRAMREEDERLATDVDWPEPREDPPEEPTEPWAREDALGPDWEEIRNRLHWEEARRGSDPEADSES